MNTRDAMEALFIIEIIRIVGSDASHDAYAVAPDTSDALLAERIEILRDLPSDIGHDALVRLVGPPPSE